MPKLFWTALMAAMLIVLSACTVGNTSVVFDTTCATGYALEGSVVGKRCVTDAELALGREEIARVVGAGAVPAIEISESSFVMDGGNPEPTPVPAAPAAPSGNTGTYVGGTWSTAGFDDKQGAMALCISDQKLLAELGTDQSQVVIIETQAPGDWETCKWQLTNRSGNATLNLPADSRSTVKMQTGNHVLYAGPMQLSGWDSMTLRLARGYVVNSFAQDPCKFAAHEVGYATNLYNRTNGEDNIMYSAGNFACPSVQGLLAPEMNMGNTQQGAAVANSQCDDIPALIGGTGTWERSPDDPNIWVYGVNEANPGWEGGGELKYPSFGYFDFWKNPGEELTRNIPDDSASFHCE